MRRNARALVLSVAVASLGAVLTAGRKATALGQALKRSGDISAQGAFTCELKRLCTAVMLSMALAGIHPAGAQAAPIISAPFVTVAVGDLFTIPISITDAVDLTLWQFDLAFDPAIVQAGAVTEGTFMSNVGATFFGPGVADNTTGLISLVSGSYVDFAPFPSGSLGLPASVTETSRYWHRAVRTSGGRARNVGGHGGPDVESNGSPGDGGGEAETTRAG